MKLAVAALVVAFSGDAALAANGCAPGTFLITPSPDGRAASVTFDQFVADNGGARTASCALAVPVTLPAGSVGVYSANYRGFYLSASQIATGQVSTLTVRHLAGTDVFRTFGPADQDPIFFSGRIGGGLAGTVDSRLTLDLLVDASVDPAQAGLDTLDLVLLGTTTVSSVAASLDQLATERAALMTHLGSTADLLLGFGQPLDGPSGAGALAAFGSTTLGANARWNVGDGITLLGGAAYVEESAGGASIDGSALLAGGVRAALPAIGAFRPFVEGGAWGSPDLAMHFTRSYANGFGVGDASGSLASVYGRAGVIVSPDARNEVALSATLAQSWLTVDAYDEIDSATNLFPASIHADTSNGDLFKVAAEWTTSVTDRLDVTLAGAVGRTFGVSPLTADVDWIGPVIGDAPDLTFVEYGGRIGWALTPATTINAFVLGTAGDKIDTHTQFGGSIKVKF